jgi:hypothetical protein
MVKIIIFIIINNNTVRAGFSVVKQRITFYIFHFCTVDKFVTADLQTISYALCIDMFMIYLIINFHLPTSTIPLAVAIKLTVKNNFRIAVTSLLYASQKLL